MSSKYILNNIILYILLFFTTICCCFAQATLSGTLRDARSGEPLIGATVLLKGTGQGTATDFEGRFLLKHDGRYPFTIECRYSGYASKSFEIERPDSKPEKNPC
jgi:iron complex outermembrane receptor protein